MSAETIHPRIKDTGVMVVDDSALQRAFTIEALHALGIEKIRQANDGFSALKQLQDMEVLPAVAIVDLEMPGMDGIELLHHVASLPAPPAIVVASSKEMALINAVETMVADLALPVLGGLAKPVSAQALVGLLARFDDRYSTSDDHTLNDAKQVDEQSLHAAIRAGQICPYFQPKADIASGRIKSVEALARWLPPGEVVIEPSVFIEAAEKYGLMPELTLCMLDQAVAAIRAWNQQGLKLTVAINLSPQSIGDIHLADTIVSRAQSAGITAEQLLFEVTETAIVNDAAAMGTLLRLRLRGFGLSIDDYGTGFSSMQQLSRLPFSELKIDRSFVFGAARRPDIRTMLESAIDMAKRLGLTTVAEGVETEEDWSLLKELGCTLAQGYLISRPAPPSGIPNFVQNFARPN